MLKVSPTFSSILVGWTTDGGLDRAVAWHGTQLVISFSITLSIPEKNTSLRIWAFVFWTPWCPIWANFTEVLWKISGKMIRLSFKMTSLSRFIVRVSRVWIFYTVLISWMFHCQSLVFRGGSNHCFQFSSVNFVKTYLVMLLLKYHLLLMTLERLLLFQDWHIFRKYFCRFVFCPV